MADERSKRDVNHVPVIAGVTNDSNTEIVQLRIDPTSKALVIDQAAYITGIGDSRKVVTAAGSAESLTFGSVAIKEVVVMAEADNTGTIVVGSSAVIATLATRRGISLTAGQSYGPIRTNNLQNICIDATVSGEGVTFVYFT